MAIHTIDNADVSAIQWYNLGKVIPRYLGLHTGVSPYDLKPYIKAVTDAYVFNIDHGSTDIIPSLGDSYSTPFAWEFPAEATGNHMFFTHTDGTISVDTTAAGNLKHLAILQSMSSHPWFLITLTSSIAVASGDTVRLSFTNSRLFEVELTNS